MPRLATDRVHVAATEFEIAGVARRHTGEPVRHAGETDGGLMRVASLMVIRRFPFEGLVPKFDVGPSMAASQGVMPE